VCVTTRNKVTNKGNDDSPSNTDYICVPKARQNDNH